MQLHLTDEVAGALRPRTPESEGDLPRKARPITLGLRGGLGLEAVGSCDQDGVKVVLAEGDSS